MQYTYVGMYLISYFVVSYKDYTKENKKTLEVCKKVLMEQKNILMNVHPGMFHCIIAHVYTYVCAHMYHCRNCYSM
jgi:hypothetical protein